MIELSVNETPLKKDSRILSDQLSPNSQMSVGFGGGNIMDSEHSELSIGMGMGSLPLNNIIKTKNDQFAGQALERSNLNDILKSHQNDNDYVEA